MSTRSLKKSKSLAENQTTVSTSSKRIENSWLLFLKEPLFQNDNFSFISLPHPASGKLTKYCLDDVHNKMYEVVSFSEPYRSWFIGQTVKSDGTVMLVTPINPLFLVLPRLKDQCSQRAVPLEDLLSEKGYNKIIDFIDNLDNIGDLKGSPDMKAYKYNKEKTLKWLKARVIKLSKVLRQKNIHVTAGAASATFVASNISNDTVDKEFYLKYACGIVSEYLSDELADELEKDFNFKPDLIEAVGKKRKSEIELNGQNKKVKNEPLNESIENSYNLNQSLTEVMKEKPLTSKEKARQKAASGTKTISSFFTKK